MILDAWGWCTGTTQREGMGRPDSQTHSFRNWKAINGSRKSCFRKELYRIQISAACFGSLLID